MVDNWGVFVPFLRDMVVSWRVCATLREVRSLVGVCLCHFDRGVVVSWGVCAILP